MMTLACPHLQVNPEVFFTGKSHAIRSRQKHCATRSSVG